METTPAVKPVHPLAKITYLHNWKEWKKAWDATSLMDVRIGLLHLGFGVALESDKEHVERMVFYLTVADGYHISNNLELEGEDYFSGRIWTAAGETEGKGLAGVRQKVAEKAFAMVALHVFKPLIRSDYRDVTRDVWVDMVNPDLFDMLLWFFRADKYERRLRNLPFGKPQDERNVNTYLTWNFLMKFCTFAFHFDRFMSSSSGRAQQIAKFLKGARPAFVKILYMVGETPMLLKEEFRSVLYDARCLKELEGLVMTEEFMIDDGTGSRYRKPKTLEEAIYAGSHAAATLRILQIRRAEQERFDKLREAEIERRDAEQKIASLTGEKKE